MCICWLSLLSHGKVQPIGTCVSARTCLQQMMLNECLNLQSHTFLNSLGCFMSVYSLHKLTFIVHSSGFLISVTKGKIRDLSVAFFVWLFSNVTLTQQTNCDLFSSRILFPSNKKRSQFHSLNYKICNDFFICSKSIWSVNRKLSQARSIQNGPKRNESSLLLIFVFLWLFAMLKIFADSMNYNKCVVSLFVCVSRSRSR